MKILLAGTDRRMALLASLLKEREHLVEEDAECGNYDAVILPYAAAMADITPMDVAKKLLRGAHLALGGANEGLSSYCRENGIYMHDYARYEPYLIQGAALTAEAAVFEAMKRIPVALMGLECLVLGYGRIGSRLCHLLRELGARVRTATRDSAELARACVCSIDAVLLDALPEVLPWARVIFGTIPAQVLGSRLLEAVNNEALLLDLASAPGTFDMLLAKERGLCAERLPGIPGYYAPLTAAKQLLASLIALVPGL